MPDRLALGLAQINPTVGDVAGNLEKIRRARAESACDLLVCSELALIGYPPEDLVLRPAVIEATRRAIDDLAGDTASGSAVLATTPWRDGEAVYNAAVLLTEGRVAAVRYKHELPNYGVFDEKRIFAAGPLPEPIEFRGVRLGVPICEDIWYPAVARHLADRGAELLIVPNGSPFERAKLGRRVALATERVRETGLGLIYVNQVGGQDELVFDGGSFVVGADERVVVRLPVWKEATVPVRFERSGGSWTCAPGSLAQVPPEPQNTYQALMLGLRDYVNKNRFPGVLLGLSGGIDSALTAAIAVDALGAGRVRGVRLPSRFTSEESQDDAAAEAGTLGMQLDTLPIRDVVDAVERTLAPLFAGRDRDITEENIQARARGLLLMAVSNKFGAMLLTTGNKSEMSVGYATLYGDMCGGYSVLKDLYKTEVYALAAWRNRCEPDGGLGPAGEVIPAAVMTKAPTAELRPNQKDQDSLPEYAALDAMLTGLVEQERSVDEIVGDGYPREVVSRTQNMLFTAEYKRRQAPPGVKTSSRSFGRDRRYPITNRFRERCSSSSAAWNPARWAANLPALVYAETAAILRSFRLSWRVLWALTLIETRRKYAGSVLGSLWYPTYSALLLGSYCFLYLVVFKMRFKELGSYQYVLFVFAGLIPYLGFSEAVSTSTSSVRQNLTLLRNAVFPIEFLPVKFVCAALFGLLSSLAILVAMIVPTSFFGWHLLYLPIAIAALFLFCVMVAWLLSAATVILPDIAHLVNVMLLLLMFMSPVGYSIDMVPPGMRFLVYLNPMTYLIDLFRFALLGIRDVPAWGSAVFLAACVAGSAIAGTFFRRLSPIFADYE